MFFLLTGGAGYIGSHVLRLLQERGYSCIVYDNLSKGHREAIKDVLFIEGDLGDRETLRELFRNYHIAAVLHFAGLAEAGESVTQPGKYIFNNICQALTLLEVMREEKVDKLIFSSSAAVYGIPSRIPIEEDDPQEPINTYGLTKLFFEKILQRYFIAYGIKYCSLRYFNAAGAYESGEIGEDHYPETHLIALACLAALGKVKVLKIFGTDYPTFDGTCIRDYIHVMDLAEAHLLALKKLLSGEKTAIYNLGNQQGFSVKEVINMVKKVTGKEFPVIEDKPRPGDPPVLVASYSKARKELGWIPKRSRLEEIVASAWNWHQKHPDGFGGKGR